ncbi:hypothetical protein C2E23DRAFT_698484, partial [Lenzites betulinus]
QPFLVAGLIMVSVLHALANVSRPYASFALAAIRVVILGTILTTPGTTRYNMTSEQRSLLERVPRDIRTVIRHLELEPDFTTYAAC